MLYSKYISSYWNVLVWNKITSSFASWTLGTGPSVKTDFLLHLSVKYETFLASYQFLHSQIVSHNKEFKLHLSCYLVIWKQLLSCYLVTILGSFCYPNLPVSGYPLLVLHRTPTAVSATDDAFRQLSPAMHPNCGASYHRTG